MQASKLNGNVRRLIKAQENTLSTALQWSCLRGTFSYTTIIVLIGSQTIKVGNIVMVGEQRRANKLI